MMQVIPTDVYSDEGDLLRIEFYNLEGEFQILAEWDERDPQTKENRESFRKWAYNMVKRLDFAVKM